MKSHVQYVHKWAHRKYTAFLKYTHEIKPFHVELKKNGTSATTTIAKHIFRLYMRFAFSLIFKETLIPFLHVFPCA
jgi:hypothetical protein